MQDDWGTFEELWNEAREEGAFDERVAAAAAAEKEDAQPKKTERPRHDDGTFDSAKPMFTSEERYRAERLPGLTGSYATMAKFALKGDEEAARLLDEADPMWRARIETDIEARAAMLRDNDKATRQAMEQGVARQQERKAEERAARWLAEEKEKVDRSFAKEKPSSWNSASEILLMKTGALKSLEKEAEKRKAEYLAQEQEQFSRFAQESESPFGPGAGVTDSDLQAELKRREAGGSGRPKTVGEQLRRLGR